MAGFRIAREPTAFSTSPSKGQKRPRKEDSNHLKWIRTLPCIITGKHGVKAAHIRYAASHYRYLEGGLDASADHSPQPRSIWNRIPEHRRDDLIEFALEHEALSTRELAAKYTDHKRYFISESSAYRILKAAT